MILVSGSVKVKEVKPQLSEYISDSLVLLRRAPVPDDIAVHDVRVLMKRARAVMKLVRPLITDEVYNREYSCFREAGRMLGEWRDLSVYRKTIRLLKKENKNLFLKLSGDDKISFLLKKPEDDRVLPDEKVLKTKEIGELLNKTLFRLRFLKLSCPDAAILIRELNQTYEEVSRIYFSCRYNTKPEKIHEFRKKSKDFLYQLYFFRQLNPGIIRGIEKKLDLLTQNLGRYNDLAQVVSYLEYKIDNPSNSQALNELIVMIKNKQDQYLSKVWPVGYKIFCPGKQLIDILGFRMLMI